MYKIENLTLSYGDKPVIKNLSLQIESSKMVGVLGLNGCGKSTLLKALGGLKKPDQGQLYLWDEDIYQMRSSRLAKKVALMLPPVTPAPAIKVKDYIEFGALNHQPLWEIPWGSQANGTKIIKQFQELDLEPLLLKTLNELSAGELMRVPLAKTLAQETSLVLLDEPAAHLDLKHQIEILDLIKNRVTHFRDSYLIVFHSMFLASHYCDEILLLHPQIPALYGSTKEILTLKNISKYFDIPENFARASLTQA
jgi:iron complex transport system ATP-binding protein